MIRSTHSISVRLCIPTRVSSRISVGRPMTRANRRATLKYSPYSSSSSLGYCCRRGGVVGDERLVQHLGGHPRRLVRVVDALAVERVDAAGRVADDEVASARPSGRPSRPSGCARWWPCTPGWSGSISHRSATWWA